MKFIQIPSQTMATQQNDNVQPNYSRSIMKYSILGVLFLLLIGTTACDDGFDVLNENPNQPTEIGAEALLPGAIRSSVNASVNMSFLVGNNIAQLSAKTLRVSVDIYQWNSYNNFVWDPLYESLRDIEGLYNLGQSEGNEAYQGAALVLKSWTYSVLTDTYGDIPYSEAIAADDGVVFPSYDAQQDIYLGDNGILAELERAANLLESTSDQMTGDILFGGDTGKWARLANALQARLWLRVSDKAPAQASSNLARLASEPLMRDHTDSGLLEYLSSAPNQFPTIPLKLGDFDAVNISARAVDSLSNWNDPRLEIYARPANAEAIAADPSVDPVYNGFANGAGEGGGSRLGYIFYNYPGHPTTAAQAKGIIMTHAEQEFIMAEAAQRGMITANAKDHYDAGVLSSMLQYGAETHFPYTSVNGVVLDTPADYMAQASVDFDAAGDKLERIAAQKWTALFFTGLEPWFDWRRTGRPAMNPAVNNENGDQVPVRFRYPGGEQLLNTANYTEAVGRLNGGDAINSAMWLMQ